MSYDGQLIGLALESSSVYNRLRAAGITEDFFVSDYQKVWKWAARQRNQHGRTPSIDFAQRKFEDLDLQPGNKRDLPALLHEIRQRKKFMDFVGLIDEVSRSLESPEDLPEVLSYMQGSLNELSLRSNKASIVDLFDPQINKRVMKMIKQNASGLTTGIPTGLRRLDSVTNGLQRKEMYVIMGRPGLGKSWIDLLFVANAVLAGNKVLLYPLEMTLEQTALRLYTIFSARLNKNRVLRNTDLTSGRITKAKVVKFLNFMEDRFRGALLVADIGTMSDPYTVERIDAETEVHQPDMFWIDYITLMKAPGIGNRNGGEDHTTVKALSNGVKHIAVRHDCVGGVSAQVNREAIKSRGDTFLPRIEHIAYGDSIGQDAGGVVSINRKQSGDGSYLYYALVKNRYGPELGKTRCRFEVNDGIIEESEHQDNDD